MTAKANGMLLIEGKGVIWDLLQRELERDSRFQLFVSKDFEDLRGFGERASIRLAIVSLEKSPDLCRLIRGLRGSYPEIAVLALTSATVAAGACLVKAVQEGIEGCVLDSDPLEQITTAIDVVAGGGSYFSSQSRDLLQSSEVAKLTSLTARQREVLRLMAEGYSTKEISSALSISVKTADHHRSRVMKRLDLHQVVNVVRFALRTRLVAPCLASLASGLDLSEEIAQFL